MFVFEWIHYYCILSCTILLTEIDHLVCWKEWDITTPFNITGHLKVGIDNIMNKNKNSMGKYRDAKKESANHTIASVQLPIQLKTKTN